MCAKGLPGLERYRLFPLFCCLSRLRARGAEGIDRCVCVCVCWGEGGCLLSLVLQRPLCLQKSTPSHPVKHLFVPPYWHTLPTCLLSSAPIRAHTHQLIPLPFFPSQKTNSTDKCLRRATTAHAPPLRPASRLGREKREWVAAEKKRRRVKEGASPSL